ncbi:MAG: Na+/H+ antiporter subunit E [Alcaligenaceae bacterium]|uniref:Na+/H+ antiporter subunit E n=1 Tax=Paenalcaligenes hermetiae TaxID=1157987 RepID=A0ABP9MC98_9BURK|nr:Na+/H+ antiporter subunit E [Alcaligenaceae bacterium]
MKYLRFTFLPLLLFFLWLLLNGFSTAHVALGAVLAIALSVAAIPFRPIRATLSHPFLALRLCWHVAVDIVKSNYDVGRIVLFTQRAEPTPGFLPIPLTLRDPHGLAALACIITYTPGTVWAGFDESTHTLTLHILDLKDEQFWLDTIQKRYQGPLIEIFE